MFIIEQQKLREDARDKEHRRTLRIEFAIVVAAVILVCWSQIQSAIMQIQTQRQLQSIQFGQPDQGKQ